MKYKATSYAFLKIGLALFIAGLILIPSAICLAQQDIEDLPDFYPESFSGDGCIDRMTTNKMVIDDRSFRLSSVITFHTPNEDVLRSWLEKKCELVILKIRRTKSSQFGIFKTAGSAFKWK